MIVVGRSSTYAPSLPMGKPEPAAKVRPSSKLHGQVGSLAPPAWDDLPSTFASKVALERSPGSCAPCKIDCRHVPIKPVRRIPTDAEPKVPPYLHLGNSGADGIRAQEVCQGRGQQDAEEGEG